MSGPQKPPGSRSSKLPPTIASFYDKKLPSGSFLYYNKSAYNKFMAASANVRDAAGFRKGEPVLLYDSVIFDLDGTLWDSCQSVAESWKDTLAKRHGGLFAPGVEDIQSIMGMTEEQIAEKLFSAYGPAALAVCQDCIRRENAYIAAHGARLYPGVEELLRTLSLSRGLYIVSNCQQGYIECFLKYTGFAGFFRDYECSGNTGLNKAENIQSMPKNLPVLFIAGEKDPVGTYGEGVRKAYESFQKAGMEKVSLKLYPEDRHELLNELDKYQVYEDLYPWIVDRVREYQL